MASFFELAFRFEGACAMFALLHTSEGDERSPSIRQPAGWRLLTCFLYGMEKLPSPSLSRASLLSLFAPFYQLDAQLMG